MDPRDAEAEFGPDYKHFDESRMVLTYALTNDDGEELEVEFPAKYEVCELCEGQGKHVNPSIDAHGISGHEFSEDPEFAEEYFNGTYDVPCYRCKGKRVEPTLNEENFNEEQKANLHLLEKMWDEEYAYRQEVMAERKMGC